MALADYRLCDVCGGKAFYDANLNYDDYPSPRSKYYPPYRIAGKELPDYDKMELDHVGDWAVLCHKCSKHYKTQIATRDSNE